MSDIDFDRIHTRVLDRIVQLERRRTVAHRVIASAILIVIAASTTAGAMIASRASDQVINSTSSCYAARSLDARHVVSTSVADFPATAKRLTLGERVEQAVATCEATFEIGTFDTAAQRERPLKSELTACMLSDGTVAVFPSTSEGGEICDRLGLAPPDKSGAGQ